MPRKIVSAIIMSLLMLGTLALAFDIQPAKANASAQWMPDSALVNGLPELGIIGWNCQCLIFNFTGNGQWILIIGQENSYTVNEYPFLGYYWNGFQWVSNPALVQGLTAYPNGNDPTVGFNVTGDNTFDMIVAQWAGNNLQCCGQCWTGYAWNGYQWVVNSTIINGLPMDTPLGGGSNYATLGYNVLGDGKWDLIVDNWGNNGYVGFEWNGTAWTQENNLVNGLPSAGSPGTINDVPVPCLAYNFANENTSTLIVGLASGGGPHGAIQGFQWNETAWTSDSAIVEGVTDLQPWPNTPTIAFNVTGDDNWVLIIGSITSNVNQPAYFTGYYWYIVPLSVSITPLLSSISIGQSLTFSSKVMGGSSPYRYQWYLDCSAVQDANSSSWTFTPTSSESYTVYVEVTDADGTQVTSDTAAAEVSLGFYLDGRSPFGSPTPPSGWFLNGTSITESVTSPISGPPGVLYVCTGWDGTGSIPPSGNASSVTFTITQSSNITWKWTQVQSSFVNIVCSPNHLSLGSSVICTATVSGSDPTGTITWSTSSGTGSFDQSVCTLTNASCLTTYTDISPGTVTITATYNGDAHNPPGISNTTLTAGDPSFWVEPTTESFIPTAPVGTLFNVTVWGSCQDFTFAWGVELGLDPSLLQCVDVGFSGGTTSGLFAGHTTVSGGPIIDNTPLPETEGNILIGESLLGDDYINASFNSLFWVEFNVTSSPKPGQTFKCSIDPGYGMSRGNTFFENVNYTEEAPLGIVPCVYTCSVLVGDITGPNGLPDGRVDMRDIAVIARCFGSAPGSSNWNPNADINDDGAVNMRDIALIARQFGNYV